MQQYKIPWQNIFRQMHNKWVFKVLCPLSEFHPLETVIFWMNAFEQIAIFSCSLISIHLKIWPYCYISQDLTKKKTIENPSKGGWHSLSRGVRVPLKDRRIHML